MNDAATDPQFEALLDYLTRTRGFDFRAYKRASLQRRILKRVQAVGCGGLGDYIDYLEVHREEFVQLFNTILINVTAFFRDPEAWDQLGNVVLPELIAAKPESDPIRVWSAGCASGEEAYSLAIVLAEILGRQRYHDRVKIYATDVDEDALAQGRQASYAGSSLEAMSEERLEKYFEPGGAGYTFDKDLRHSVIFGRHDLIQDSPISRLDLIACRNTLMYFDAEIQARVLARFHFALGPNGMLFLGRAENIYSRVDGYVGVDPRRRIFRKVDRGDLRGRLMLMTPPGGAGSDLEDAVRLREAAADSFPLPQLVVSRAGIVIYANAQMRNMFGLGPRDFGRPLQDLEISYRPVELRTPIEQARADRRPIVLRKVASVNPAGTSRTVLEVRIAPILDANGDVPGVAITFEDVTRSERLQEELQHSNQELETAMQELQTTNEELETSNEELQSTNEELQSTNEELETMNEELQSTNEELTTMNDELRRRTEEYNAALSQFESVLASMRLGVVVVDREMRIQAWNPRATDLWGLRETEVQGQSLLKLDIGLPVEHLTVPVRECLNLRRDGDPLVLQAVNRRGRTIEVEVRCSPLRDQAGAVLGVVLLMEERVSN